MSTTANIPNSKETGKELHKQVRNELPDQGVKDEEELPLNYTGPIPYASAVELGIIDSSK